MKKTTLLLILGLCFGISGLAQGSSKEAEDFYNFYSYYHSKWELVVETEGKKETVTLNAKKTSFVLDGKLAPPKIAAVAGREAVLCHYRSEKVPHKILVRSHDDSIFGMTVAMNSETLRLASPAGSHQISIEKDVRYQVDGVPADLQAVIKKGGDHVVYPKRGRTIIAFAPQKVN